VEDAFRLTGFFFSRHVYEPRGIEEPDARGAFLAALRKHRISVASAPGETAA
jgi:DNA repair protein RecO (recombination protein O)